MKLHPFIRILSVLAAVPMFCVSIRLPAAVIGYASHAMLVPAAVLAFVLATGGLSFTIALVEMGIRGK